MSLALVSASTHSLWRNGLPPYLPPTLDRRLRSLGSLWVVSDLWVVAGPRKRILLFAACRLGLRHLIQSLLERISDEAAGEHGQAPDLQEPEAGGIFQIDADESLIGVLN